MGWVDHLRTTRRLYAAIGLSIEKGFLAIDLGTQLGKKGFQNIIDKAVKQAVDVELAAEIDPRLAAIESRIAAVETRLNVAERLAKLEAEVSALKAER